MKIYFSGSLRGKRKYESNYRLIVSNLQTLGHEVEYEYLFKVSDEDVAKQTKEQQIAVHRQLAQNKVNCDLVIAELSYRSFAQGQEIAHAFRIGKPVLGLYVGNQKPHLIISDAGDRLLLLEYNASNVSEVLRQGIDYYQLRELKRFTLNLPAHLIDYLDHVARDTQFTRSEYIRLLLEQDLRKSKV